MSQLGQLAAVSTSIEIRAVIQQAMLLAAVLFFFSIFAALLNFCRMWPRMSTTVASGNTWRTAARNKESKTKFVL